MDSTQVMKGLLDTATLAALGTSPTHGYDLVRRLHASGLIEVAEASVYGTLRRLFRSGYLSAEVRESNAGPPRKIYALNEKGRRQLRSSRTSWVDVRKAMDDLLGVKEED
jgi:PadR family transcriptional regulator PadR